MMKREHCEHVNVGWVEPVSMSKRSFLFFFYSYGVRESQARKFTESP